MCEYFIEMEDRLKNHPFADSIKNFILSFEDEELKKYLSFLYLHMPYADIANVDKEVILDYAKLSVYLRNTRCKDLDEDIFLNYVLFHRIGSEKIVANRTFFYDLIKDMLGESETENVLKLNYFCGKNVTYRTTDIRTLDPITIYKSSFGRCGEESIFAVSVFRAAGIPARQIYVPLWAHCDDNHAWVEVYVDNDWHYLGACEPEEILDKGWFDDASARAMIVKNILYGNIKKEATIIDGANYFQIYSKIMIPLTLPAISTISIFNFMGAWNNILFPLLFINDKRLRPISLGLLNFNGERGSEYGLMMAGIVITVAVPLAIYLLFQEKVESGLAAGAVKE